MKGYLINQKSINYINVAAILLVLKCGYAEEYFNPAFLKDGLSDADVSDLSHFYEGKNILPGTYRVEIYVNGEYFSTQDITFFENEETKDLVPCLNIQALKAFGVNTLTFENDPDSNFVDNSCISFLQDIKDSQSNFDSSKQKLFLSFPQASMISNYKGYISPSLWQDGINALFVNYNFTGNNTSHNSDSYYLNLESGLNLGAWQYRQVSTWSYNKDNKNSNSKFRSLLNYIQRPISQIKSQLIVGDGYTNGDFFDSVGFRGVRLYTAENMYSSSQQGYAPTVRGIAKSEAKVIIKQNGYVIYQLNVPPGPFIIDDLNSTASSGDLTVIVEESDGSYQTYTVPYSTLPNFQREGRVKYDVVAGEYRSGNDQQNNINFAQFSMIAGLKKGVSVFFGTQLANKYKSGLIGLGKNFGTFGALSFDYTYAQSELVNGKNYYGSSFRALYSKTLNNMGTNFQIIGYRYSTNGFYTLNDVAYKTISGYSTVANDYETSNPSIISYHNFRYNKKGRFQISLSQSLGESGRYGSIYVSGNQQSYWGTGAIDEWYQTGYSNSWDGVSFSLSLNTMKSLYLKNRDNLISMNVSLPLSLLTKKYNSDNLLLNNAYASFSATRSSEGHENFRTGINGTLNKDRSLSYYVNQGYRNSTTEDYSGSLGLRYQGAYNDMGISYNYDSYQTQLNYNISGAALLHQDGLTLGQKINDTAILVKAPGASNAKIENYTGVKTDSRGYAILPYANSYQINRVALDINSLGDDVDVIDNVDHVIPIQGAIARATFDTHVGIKALLTLIHDEKFIPFGSIVTENNSHVTGIVAEDGTAYLSGLPISGELLVQWGTSEKQKCMVKYDFSEDKLVKSILQKTVNCQ